MPNSEPNASGAQMPNRECLLELADAYGVAHEFWEISGVHHRVCDETLLKVLTSMGADVSSNEAAYAAASHRRERAWYRTLPPCTVVTDQGGTSLKVHVPHGTELAVWVEYEPGITDNAGATRRALAQEEDLTEPREIEGHLIGQASFAIPSGLPLGYHTVYAQIKSAAHDSDIISVTDYSDSLARDPDAVTELAPSVTATNSSAAEPRSAAQAALIVTPQRMNDSRLESARSWGMMLQLYSVTSETSWGVGDLHDLVQLSQIFGNDGADFVLINPLHAGEPIGHMQPSPYLPVSRRFFNPIYIHPESIPEWERLSAATQEEIHTQKLNAQKLNVIAASACGSASTHSSGEGDAGGAQPAGNVLIDRDGAWEAKRTALQAIFEAGRSRQREQEFAEFRREAGQGLEDFALWCALLERNFNNGDSRLGSVPELHSEQMPDLRGQLAERINFWAWLQWIMDEQLAAVQRTAKDAGMRYGICHDLAVGVHPCGADVWALGDAFARGMQVGAPPDYYCQQGQNWSQPPWNPVALEELAYAPVRDMVRTIIRHAGALRLDHVMGLFRLYWIPEGNPASDGTYVYFDHEAMLGVILLEAQRAGAIIIGEDLGTVEPWIRDVLQSRGILGTSVFWFEKQGDGWPKQPWDYRRDVLATVDTHDLPPVAGYWNETHIDVREKLGLLVEPVEHVRGSAAWERELVMRRLREHGLLGDEPQEQNIIEAMHAYVCHTPSQLIGVSLTDALGDKCMQNQPGTDQEYPNWRVPLRDDDGELVPVEKIARHSRYRSLVAVLRQFLG